jgi:hypothetical protein
MGFHLGLRNNNERQRRSASAYVKRNATDDYRGGNKRYISELAVEHLAPLSD